MQRVFIFEQGPFRSCHASTVVETGAGPFLVAWFGGRREGADDVAIWLSRLDDGKWSPPEKVAEEPRNPCWNPVLFRERGGEVQLYYMAGPDEENWSGFIRRSTDGGATWRAPELMPAGLYGPIKNKPIQLADGTIVAGTSVESYRTWACWVELSRDGGNSWSRQGPIFVPGELYGIIQPTLLERRDGSILMLARATQRIGFICRSESRDGGLSWTPAEPTDLPNPDSGIDAVGLGDGRFVLAHNPTHTDRSPLVLSVSEDEGRSWRAAVTLEDDPGEYSYPAIVQASDGRVHVTYTWQRRRIAHAIVEPSDLG